MIHGALCHIDMMNWRQQKSVGGMWRISSGRRKSLNFKMWRSATSPLRCRCKAGIPEKWFMRLRTLQLPVLRLHSHRAREFTGVKLRDWCTQRDILQTSTAGDESAGNGRCESELGIIQAQTRVHLRAAGLEANWWPLALRHTVEQRRPPWASLFRRWYLLARNALQSSSDGTDEIGTTLLRRSGSWVQQWGWVQPAKGTTSNPWPRASSCGLPWWWILQSFLHYYHSFRSWRRKTTHRRLCQKTRVKTTSKTMWKNPWRSAQTMWWKSFMLTKGVPKSKYMSWTPNNH